MKKNFTYIFLLLTVFVFTGCEENVFPEIDYVSFEAKTFDFGVDIGSANTRDIKIYRSDISGSARTVNVSVDNTMSTADPASYTVPATATFEPNSNVATLSVSISDLNIGSAGETLVLTLTSADSATAGEPITLNIFQVCPFNDVVLSLTFDRWPEEAGYVLADGSGTVDMVAVGGFAAEPDDSTWTKEFCLPGGNYTFTINDGYGDGGTSVTITSGGSSWTISPTSYTATASVMFTLP